jgi:DNA topoisomerase-3
MKKYLLIAEKPSLCKEIQKCYNNHKDEIHQVLGMIDFIALAGHVCCNFQPTDYDDWADVAWKDIDYPMIPRTWKIKLIDDARKKQIVNDIKGRIDNYDGVIVGTDSDQEGYGIYYLLEQYLHIQDKPALRFMEHSLTDGEILKSLLSMTDYHTDPAHVHFTQAFLLRSRADWLYGMNVTRMMSVNAGSVMAVGRVKAPTIKLVYDNSTAIENFKEEKYYQLEANYGDFSATLLQDDKPARFTDSSSMPTPPLAGQVEKKEGKQSAIHAPKLYDLTAIQEEAGAQYGYKPNETLEIIQSLYEKHKIVSYPRTQCQYVSSEKAKEFPAMLKNVAVFPELSSYVAAISDADIQRVFADKQVVNDSEVQKESHDALLPTDKMPVLSELNEKERNVCLMIYKRLLAQFLPQVVEDKVQLVLKHGDYRFVANGKTVVNQGWRVLYKEKKDVAIPELEEGESVTAKEMKKAEKKTTSPKRLTQATLIAAMKNIANQISDPELKKSLADSQGIGTPATRAAIISDILARGYVTEQKNGLYISDVGKAYIESMKDVDIVSPVFAARMDTQIKKIQRGETEYDDVYNMVVTDLKKVCHQVENLKVAVPKADYHCKKCGELLEVRKYSYSCPKCEFKVPKTVGGKVLDKAILDALFDGQTTQPFTFKKKDGSTFKARLKMGEDGLAYDFSSGIPCPKCGKDTLKINNGGAFCDCGLKVYRKCCNHEFTDAELKKLLTGKTTPEIKDFISKAGKSFSACVKLNGEFKTEFVFNKGKTKK